MECGLSRLGVVDEACGEWEEGVGGHQQPLGTDVWPEPTYSSAGEVSVFLESLPSQSSRENLEPE